jgi:LmbE family N-acetylglucosaminyl deacetylase
MKIHRLCRFALLGILSVANSANAQSWRHTAATLGTSARVLIIGARPEDEDNALIAWLSLGRNVETAYLSITRGESANNVAGTERQSALGVVRTAELLAERQRDGAHQYFTRAYDFGRTTSDSIVDAAWPHDSLLADVVNIVRAFRPHVIISMISDANDRDATRRMTARLAREAYSYTDVADPGRRPNWNSQWTVSRLFTLVRGDAASASVTRINVGEFDRTLGKSYAEIGAEVRRLQRTQTPPAADNVGRLERALRLDSTRAGPTNGLFDGIDTTWQRFKGVVSDTTYAQIDSLQNALHIVRGLASGATAGDSIADALANVVKRAIDVRTSFSCSSSVIPRCGGALGDVAVSVDRVRLKATEALLSADGIVVDGTVDRQLVAVGDTVQAAAMIYNGGTRPVAIRRLAVDSRTTLAVLLRDSTTTIAPDSVARWNSRIVVRATDLHWWQVHGLKAGTYFHDIAGNAPQIVSGEDRIATNGVEATFVVAGVDIPVLHRPLVQRDVAMLRGDDRHPLTGVTPLSVLLERSAEYERANMPIDRFFRVFLSSAKTTPETVTVSLRVPPGLRVDSAAKVAIVPAIGTRNVFFRLRGIAKPGSDSVSASASLGATAPPASGPPTVGVRPAQEFNLRAYNYGFITHDYPHIPSQEFIRGSNERMEAVDLKVPPRLKVGYIKGADDVQTALGQLQVDAHALEPSLVPLVDLSFYSTILIGAGAMTNEALASGIPALREFMNRGGAVVVMAGGEEVARSGLLPFPITFDSEPQSVSDPAAPVRITQPVSQLMAWPNKISVADFDSWVSERARNLPATFDQRYRSPLSVEDHGAFAPISPLLVASVGKGMLVFSSLSVDRELNAVHAGAARLFINLLSAGLRPGTTK